MSDKERLEEIKNSYLEGLHRLFGASWVSMPKENFDWLIQQAERVEKLEEENDELAERVHKLALDWSELVDERNRYKQALEFYAHKKNYDIKHLSEDEHEIPVFKDYGEKARNALERDEN
jgi:hypothetical protein